MLDDLIPQIGNALRRWQVLNMLHNIFVLGQVRNQAMGISHRQSALTYIHNVCCLHIYSRTVHGHCSVVGLFVYLVDYEFLYQDHLFTRKCCVCEQFRNVHKLWMNSCLSKLEP